jgi:hypothetical protein
MEERRNYMKLLTKGILDNFKKQGDTSQKQASDIKIIVKFFGGGACSWYCYEYDPKSRIYEAFVNLGNYAFAECGSVSQDELESIKFRPLGLSVERDMYFGDHTLQEVIDKVKSGGHI